MGLLGIADKYTSNIQDEQPKKPVSLGIAQKYISQPAEASPPPGGVVSETPPVPVSPPLVEPQVVEANPAGTGFSRAIQRGAIQTAAGVPALAANVDMAALADADKTPEAIRFEEARRAGVPNQAFASRAADISDPVQTNQMMQQYGVSPQANVNFQQVVDKRLDRRQDALENTAEYYKRISKNSDVAGRLFNLAREFEKSPTADAYAQSLAEAPDTFKGYLATITDDPLGFLAFMGETIAENVPQIAAGVGASVATGSPLAGATIMSLGGFSREYATSVDNFLRENNIDLANPEAVKAMFADKELMKEASSRGLVRGLVIGSADAAGQGAVALKVIQNSLARQTVAQAASEGAGEALATKAVGDPFSVKETTTEALAGGATTTAEGLVAKPKIDPVKQASKEIIKNIEDSDAVFQNTAEIARQQTQTPQPEPVAPPVDDTRSDPTATTQADDFTPPSEDSPVDPPEQPKKVKAETEDPEQPKAPKADEAPKVDEEPQPPKVEAAPDLPNPQEADEVGASTDDVVKSVQTPDGQKNYNVKGKVVELDDLKQATGELQPRDRSRKESEALSKERAGSMFNPERLLDDPTSGSGAPIIARDGTIMSGNGRVLTLQEVYANQPESLSKYRASLEGAGINTEGFSQPVFVRMLTDDMSIADLKEFADLSNTEAQAQMSMTERAGRDAKRLTDSKIIELYRGDFDIDTAQNRKFVQEYAKKILSPTEQGAFFDSEGAISQEGISRVRNAILASAFDNSDTIATMLESSDANIKAISNAFMSAAPKFAQLKKQVADGRTEARWDITPRLAEMANLISRLRRDGMKVEDYFNQTDMLSAPDPALELLVRAFYNPDLSRANSTKAMKDFLDFYVEEALQKETGGFLEDTTTPDDVIEAGRKRTEAKRNEGQGRQTGLFESNVQSDETRSKQVQKQPVSRSRQDARQSDQAAERQVNDTRSPSTLEESIEGVEELRNTKITNGNQAQIREQNTRGTKTGRILISESETLRQSLYRDAFTDAGENPDVMVNRPQQEQFKKLQKLLKDKFDFRYVAPPQQGANYDQVNALLDAYHNLQWMSHVLGMPNRGIGLEGSLGLGLPQRAWGGYMAAYIPNKNIMPNTYQSDVVPITGAGIIMPGRSNSFAHEWGHALDFYLVDRLGSDWNKGLTGRIRTNLKKGESAWIDGAPKNVVEAMGDLMNALFYDDAEVAATIMKMESEIAKLEAKPKPTKKLEDLKRKLKKLREGSTKQRIKKSKYRENAAKFAERSASDVKYWTKPTEMFARAFEAYIATQVEHAGGSNEFITSSNEAYQMALDKVEGADERLALTYPKDSERMKINLAMGRLMDELRAALIIEGTPAQAPGDSDTLDGFANFYDAVDRGQQKGPSLWQDQVRRYRAHKQERKRIANRPREHKSLFAGFQDLVGANLINTKRGYLFILASRYKDNPKIKKLIEQIIARVATDPGSTDDRVTVSGGTFEEAVRGASRQYAGRFINILNKYELDTFTEEELKQLRLFLTSDRTAQANAPAKISKAAGEIRTKLLNPMYDYMRKNGLDLNYIPDAGYMPRMLDSILAINDAQGFIFGNGQQKRGAKALYSDVIYENEYGVLDEGDIDQGKALVALGRKLKIVEYLEDNAPGILEQVNELQAALQQIEAIETLMENGESTTELEQQLEELKEQAQQLQPEVYEGLRDPYADIAAHDWFDRLTARQVGDLSRNGVQGEFAKKRKLPPEADTYMIDYYLNPVEAIMEYIPGVARTVEYNKRFGPQLVPKGKRKKVTGGDPSSPLGNHDFLSYTLEQMALEGMARPEIEQIRFIVDTVTGRKARTDHTLAKTLDYVHAYGSMALLPRAVISSIAEPMTAATQTGRTRDGLKVLKNTIGEAMASIGTATMKERRAYYRELGNILGVIDLPETGETIANRVGGTSEDTSRAAQRMARFFYRTGLISLTNSQRRSSMRVGIQYITELGKRYTNPNSSQTAKERAAEALQDFGVAKDDLDQFAKYAASLKMDKKGMYEIDQIIDRSGELTDMGQILSVAVRRFTDQTVQDPKVIDRPKWAEEPIGRIVYGIQSFISAFTRNVLLQSAKVTQREFQKRGALRGTEMMFRKAWPLVALYASHTAVSALREYLLNRERWEQEDEDDTLLRYLAQLGFSRSGMLGRFDPVANAFFSLKYQADLTNLLAGASLSYYSKAVGRIAGLGYRNSENTVSSEYQAARGVYDLLVPTALTYIATTGYAGVAVGLGLGAATIAGTSPTIKHFVLRNLIYELYGQEYYPGRSGRSKKTGRNRSSLYF